MEKSMNQFFGKYGGQFVPQTLKDVLTDLERAFENAIKDPSFIDEYKALLKNYVGRPSSLYYAKRLSKENEGAQIWLKREDLNHTGAHKINNTIGQILLAKRMGKMKVIAETGAGQHGVATATAAAMFGMECDIYQGEIDTQRQKLNVTRMEMLGAKVIPVNKGTKTLTDAVDAAIEAWVKEPDAFYLIGSVVGPHPYPKMVKEFQKVIGEEARKQFLECNNTLPDALVACVGGGSNAIGLFTAFLNDPVKIYGVEAAGKGINTNKHAATLTLGKEGLIHGMNTIVLKDEEENVQEVYSISPGLDYPGVGPEHAYLKDMKRVQYESIDDREAVDAFLTLSRTEGIIPAIESSHAIAYALKLAKTMDKSQRILVNLSGRGDKDVESISQYLKENK
jgi:tryptophan synthase beta chain